MNFNYCVKSNVTIMYLMEYPTLHLFLESLGPTMLKLFLSSDSIIPVTTKSPPIIAQISMRYSLQEI